MSQVRQVMQRGKVQYGLQRFIVDTPDDLLKLPAKTVPGSTAYVVSTGARYVHNTEHVWVKIKQSVSNGSSSGDGNGSNNNNNNQNGVGDIWDGGDIDTDVSYDEIIVWDGGDVDGIEGITNTKTDNSNGGEV